MKPLYVSFYTPDYADEAVHLAASFHAFWLNTEIRPAESLGSWTRNCGRKPVFIREMMGEYPGRSIIWLDADARVRQYPALFDSLTCDFAAHWRHGSELLSGTLYFGPTERAMDLVEAWCHEQSKCPDEWDQRTLARVIERGDVPGLIIRHLPSEYVRVFDDAKMGEPIVEHMQASRRLAKKRVENALLASSATAQSDREKLADVLARAVEIPADCEVVQLPQQGAESTQARLPKKGWEFLGAP